MTTCFPNIFRRRRTSDESENFDELCEMYGVHLYSYGELRSATDDFSRLNKIGQGGFGPVFAGKLRDGKLAAIKLLSADSQQGVKEFLNELQTISDVNHENLVKLYGCCVEGGQRILVYEYLENNSLSRTLLGGACGIHFSWPTRVKICIGVAKGLAYLHEEVRPHIIHRDIKASNVLLDEDLNPKISDFGLAKLVPANMTHVSTRVAGTIGYLAPEYAVKGQVTQFSDIYSFGVLLIEIVSGRCHTNKRLPRQEQYILERAWHLYKRNKLVMLVDTALDDDFDEEQACSFLKVGLLCTQDNPKHRPLMSAVVEMLTGAQAIVEDGIRMPSMINEFLEKKSGTSSDDTLASPNISKSLGSDTFEVTTATSTQYSHPTMSFTAISDRSS